MELFLRMYFWLLLLHPLFAYIIWKTLQLPANKIYKAIFIVLSFFYFLTSKRRIKFPKYLWFLVGYAIYVLLWDIHNGFFQVRGPFIYFSSFNYLHMILLVLFLENLPSLHSLSNKLMSAIPLVIFIAFIFSVIQVVCEPYFWSNTGNIMGEHMEGNKYLARRPSIFGWGNPLNIGIGFFPLAAVFIANQIETNKKYVPWLFFLLVIAVASNTRYVLASFLIISIYPLYYSFKRKKIISALSKLKNVSIAVIIGYFFSAQVLNYDINKYFNERVFHEESIQKNTRVIAVYTFLEFFPKNPFFGDGFRVSDEVRQASNAAGSSHIHVGYLQRLVSYGIVGCFFLFTFLFLFTKRLWKIGKKHHFYGGFIAFSIFIFANATFTHFSFFFFGIVISLLITFNYEKEQKIRLRAISNASSEAVTP